MNKVICDVCGTAYPETATQCPICGCAKPETDGMPPLETGNGEGGQRSYTFVKGGRFSKSNVRKRNKANGTYQNYDPDDDDELIVEGTPPSNRGLIVAIVFLVIAILAVLAYILLNFTGGDPAPTEAATLPSYTVQTEPATEPEQTTEDTAPVDLSCKEINLEEDYVELCEVGENYLINLMTSPADTVDAITFESSDSNVVTVSDDGRLTAVAAGSAEITITCGSVTAKVTVDCNLPTPGLDPNGEYEIMLNNTYVSKAKYGAEASLGPNDTIRLTFWKKAPAGQPDEQVEVEWVIGDENVCTMDGDTVKHVGKGTTTIKVKVGDTVYDEYTFKIICSK